uniref:Uncharacterized protein n=1 Tax=Romanomermis culicivorax TaxID=13658 RepID=A0A915K3T5_ROMCU
MTFSPGHNSTLKFQSRVHIPNHAQCFPLQKITYRNFTIITKYFENVDLCMAYTRFRAAKFDDNISHASVLFSNKSRPKSVHHSSQKTTFTLLIGGKENVVKVNHCLPENTVESLF